jgi:hypothetical protein
MKGAYMPALFGSHVVGRKAGRLICFGLVLLMAGAGLVLYALASIRPAQAGPGSDPALVRCEPVVALGPATTTLSVDIYVENVSGLYGADIQLLFDPVAAQVVDADPNMPGAQIQPLAGFLSPDFVIRREANNTSGLIWYAVTQTNPSPPATGSGAVARVTFQPQSTAAFTMPVTNHQLSAAGGVPLASIAQACTVVFQPCADVTADGQVGVDDLIAVATRWTLTAADPDPDNDPLTPDYHALYDLNHDGVIDIVDIMLVSARWLETC